MTTVTAINNIGPGLADSDTTPIRQSFRRWNTGLLVSAVSGVVTALGGFMVGVLAIAELVVPSTTLYTLGTLLIGASFILLGFAAHCLDKAYAADKTIRMGYCRQAGLKDEEYEESANTK